MPSETEEEEEYWTDRESAADDAWEGGSDEGMGGENMEVAGPEDLLELLATPPSPLSTLLSDIVFPLH